MSSVTEFPGGRTAIRALPLEERRGIWAMWCVITTEAALFACLFAAYFYLGNGKERWQINTPPKMALALVLLAILLVSSAVMHFGQKRLQAGQYGASRIMLAITILLGLIFLVLQCYEYADHWKTLTPFNNSYGSIFYTITTFHALHLIVGLLILLYVIVLPRYAPAHETPFRPYETAALYWHFVDAVWVFVVLILYLIPNWVARG